MCEQMTITSLSPSQLQHLCYISDKTPCSWQDCCALQIIPTSLAREAAPRTMDSAREWPLPASSITWLSSLSLSSWGLELSLFVPTLEGEFSFYPCIIWSIWAIFRLASKTTDVNWSKKKDLADVVGYYENRQFKWFNPRGVDYSKLSDDRPKYMD